ncbi:MAG: hypothetical protein AAGD92_09735 [Pseudomonadota bacterium]
MNIKRFWIAVCAAMGGGLSVASAEELSFRKIELSVSAPVFENVSAMHLRQTRARDLLIHVRNDAREHFFEVYNSESLMSDAPQAPKTIKIPRNAIYYALGETPSDERDALLILTETGIEKYDVGADAFVPLIASRSIFRQGIDFRFILSGFARDLNDDGRYDLMVPDFDGMKVYIQKDGGGFREPILLPVEPEMRLTGQYSNDNISDTELAPPAPTTPAFSVFPSHLFDATGDGRSDIVFNVGVDLVIFAQTEDGAFDTKPRISTMPFDVRGNRWVDEIAANESNADQSRFRDITVYRIVDLDADDIAEVVTVENKASGVFDREQTFSIYKGQIRDGLVTYDRTPEHAYALEGVGGVGFRDIDNNGRFDLAVTSLKLNIGKVISVLLTRKLKIHTRFYFDEPDGGFSERHDFRRSTQIGVDLSRGLTNNPALVYADFDGDEGLDLLANADENELIVLRGGAQEPFETELASLDVVLPSDGSLVDALAINNDAREDIVVRYSRLGLDGAERRNRLVLFLSE